MTSLSHQEIDVCIGSELVTKSMRDTVLRFIT